MKLIVAIDPKKHVLWCATRLLFASGYLCTGIPTVPKLATVYFDFLARLGVRDVVYEDCYFSHNQKVFADMYYVKERMRECAEDGPGLTFTAVKPTAWQSVMLFLPGENSRKVKRDELKRRSLVVAKKLAGVSIPSDDVCDSICLHAFASRQYGVTYEQLNKKGRAV